MAIWDLQQVTSLWSVALPWVTEGARAFAKPGLALTDSDPHRTEVWSVCSTRTQRLTLVPTLTLTLTQTLALTLTKT